MNKQGKTLDLKSNTLYVLIGLLLLSLGMVGCGQDAVAQSVPTSTVEAIEDTVTPLPAALRPTPLPVSSDSSLSAEEAELISQGEEIYQVTAGAIGCQACHGRDALGDVGPGILGKSAETIWGQLESNEAMQFIILTEAEVDTLAAYLGWLADQ